MCAKPSNTSSFTRHNKFCYRAWARASPINHQLLHGMHSKVITLNMDDKLDYSHTIPGLHHRISPCTFIAKDSCIPSIWSSRSSSPPSPSFSSSTFSKPSKLTTATKIYVFLHIWNVTRHSTYYWEHPELVWLSQRLLHHFLDEIKWQNIEQKLRTWYLEETPADIRQTWSKSLISN